MLFSFFLLITCIILSNCDNNKGNSKYDNNAVPRIIVEPIQENITLNLSSIAKSLDVVKLESSEESMLSSFAQLKHVDNSHIIFRDGDRILIFDREGNYLNEINSKGKGPKEYSGVLNSYIDSELDLIYIIDRKNIKIYNYAGAFVENFSNNIPSGGLSKINKDGFILAMIPIFTEDNREMLTILDNKLNKIKTFNSKVNYNLINVKQDFVFTSIPYVLKDQIYYKEPIADTIFKLSEDSLIPHWVIDLNDYKPDIKDALSVNQSNNSKNKILGFGFSSQMITSF